MKDASKESERKQEGKLGGHCCWMRGNTVRIDLGRGLMFDTQGCSDFNSSLFCMKKTI